MVKLEIAQTPFASTLSLDTVHTLNHLFALRVRISPDKEAYRQFDPVDGKWLSYTWQAIAMQVEEWCRAIASLNLPHGARVAILLPNGIDAVSVDQACLALGLVPVPMHALDNPASIGYILSDCQASLLVAASYDQWRAIVNTRDEMPSLKLVVLIQRGEFGTTRDIASGSPLTLSKREWMCSISWIPISATRSSLNHVSADDLAAIVYTSGTMGKPKGVMLTHRNIMANVSAVLARIQVQADDVFLSFLPLSHTFERTVGYYLPIAAGSCVAYARSVALIAEDLKTVRPTILVSVPRIYERFYTKLQEKLAASNRATRFLFQLAQTVGWRHFCRQQDLPGAASSSAYLDAILLPVLKALVARAVLSQFGGRVRAAVSGGAPMSQAVAQCFLGLGLPLLQGYGMTETSPVVATNTLGDNRPTTVGRPLDGVEVRLGENSELQIRSAGVMQGYWNRPEETSQAITADGWLRTGDQAVLEQGRIRICGRIKEIIVTSTGEKIAPLDLELAVMADPLFEQVMVVGDNQAFIAACVVLNHGLWEPLARSLNLDPSAPGNLNAASARALLLQRIQQATRAFPHYAVPRAVWATLSPWTLEGSMITPTLKLKRRALQSRLQAEIEAIYANHPNTVSA